MTIQKLSDRVGSPKSAIVEPWKDITAEVNLDSGLFSNLRSPVFSGYKIRRVGDSLELQFKMISSAKVDDSLDAEFYLPNGLTSMGRIQNAGTVTTYNVRHSSSAIGQSFWTVNVQAYENSNKIVMYDLGGGNVIKRNQVEDNGQFYVHATIPIAEWEGQGTTYMLDTSKQSVDLAGQVITWPSENLPTGWLWADGSTYLKTEYPDLYSSLGDAYNEAEYIDDSGSVQTYPAVADGFFRVPDYRNVYLRGSGGTSLNGSILDDATAVNGLGLSWSSTNVNTGNNSVGHTHNVVRPSTTTSTNGLVDGEALSWRCTQAELGNQIYALQSVAGNATRGQSSGQSANHTHAVNKNQWNTNQSWSGDTETRPKTAVVRHIIRAWNASGSAIGIPKATEDSYGLVPSYDYWEGSTEDGSLTIPDSCPANAESFFAIKMTRIGNMVVGSVKYNLWTNGNTPSFSVDGYPMRFQISSNNIGAISAYRVSVSNASYNSGTGWMVLNSIGGGTIGRFSIWQSTIQANWTNDSRVYTGNSPGEWVGFSYLITGE